MPGEREPDRDRRRFSGAAAPAHEGDDEQRTGMTATEVYERYGKPTDVMYMQAAGCVVPRRSTLDARGRAILALSTSAGTAYCLRLERDGRCKVTYARAGEIARPGLYNDREDSIASTCGRCPPAPGTN